MKSRIQWRRGQRHGNHLSVVSDDGETGICRSGSNIGMIQPGPRMNAKKSGMALFSVMTVMGALAVVGATSYLVTRTELAISDNYHRRAKAFAFADAGVDYTRANIESAFVTGAFADFRKGSSRSVSYAAPSGFKFDTITNVSRTASGSYFFTVQGRDSNALASISSVWNRKQLLTHGVFGRDLLDLKSSLEISSYASAMYPIGEDPDSSDSTHSADVASDGVVVTRQDTSIDGNVDVGATAAGTYGSWTSVGTALITGSAGQNVGYIEPDPMGAIGGTLAATFTVVAAVNDNARAIPPIVGGVASVGNGEVLTLPSGNYYLTSLRLNHGSILNIQATNGPVKIYLDGIATFVNSSAINGAHPTDFAIYSRSSETITVGNSADFKGLIYAPYAIIDMKNGGDVYGVIWGRSVYLRNSANMFVDTSILESTAATKLKLVAWKENRGN